MPGVWRSLSVDSRTLIEGDDCALRCKEDSSNYRRIGSRRVRPCLVALHVYMAPGLDSPTCWHPLCRSYLSELLLDKGYIVHGLSRNAASCCSPNLASLMAAGEAVKALLIALLCTNVDMFITHFGLNLISDLPLQASTGSFCTPAM